MALACGHEAVGKVPGMGYRVRTGFGLGCSELTLHPQEEPLRSEGRGQLGQACQPPYLLTM